MKSIQGVSIWKILGSFLVLTMCLSEAHSSDGSPLEKERPVPALVASVGHGDILPVAAHSSDVLEQEKPKSALVASVSHGDILPVAAHSRDEAALDEAALREQIHTLIASGKIVFEAVSSGGRDQEEKAGVRRRGAQAGPVLEEDGQDMPEGAPLQLQRLKPSSSTRVLRYWVPLFSVPFMGDVKNFILACLGDLPPCPDCFFLSQRLGLLRDAVLYPPIRIGGAFILSIEVAGLLGELTHSTILAVELDKRGSYPDFMKDIISQVQDNQKSITDAQAKKPSYWQKTLPFYKLSLPLLSLGAYASYAGWPFMSTLMSLSAFLFAQYPCLKY